MRRLLIQNAAVIAMGLAMPRNLIKAGHALTVYNQTRSRAEDLEPLGVKIARISFREAGL